MWEERERGSVLNYTLIEGGNVTPHPTDKIGGKV